MKKQAKHALASVEGFQKRASTYYYVDPRVLIIEEGFNPRQGFGDNSDLELKANIKENGVIEPIKTQKIDSQLIVRDGGRRHWAVMQLIDEGTDINTVPIVLIDKATTPANALFLAINSDSSKPLSPIEEANAFDRLKKYGFPVKAIAQKIGKTEVFVYERLKLINASQETKKALENKEISVQSAARAISKSNGNIEKQNNAVEKAKAKIKREKIKISWSKKADKYIAKGNIGTVWEEDCNNPFLMINDNFFEWMQSNGYDPESLVLTICKADEQIDSLIDNNVNVNADEDEINE